MTKTFPASADTTYGLFHAEIQFPSELEMKTWEKSLLDFDAIGTKEKLKTISKIWDEYPRTTLFEKILKKPLTVENFLQFLKNLTSANKEFFEITQSQNSIKINAYLGSYEAIEDYAELLFLSLILASEAKATGQGFLFPDNYYNDFYDFVAITMTAEGFDLECDDTQNIDEDLGTKVEELEPIIKANYQKWLK